MEAEEETEEVDLRENRKRSDLHYKINHELMLITYSSVVQIFLPQPGDTMRRKFKAATAGMVFPKSLERMQVCC